MKNFLRFFAGASLFVLFAAVCNLRADDNSLVLPYDQMLESSDNALQPEDATVEASMPAMTQPSLAQSESEQTASLPQTLPPPPPPSSSEDPFAEVQLDPTSFRNAKTTHTNLIVALTQQEQRDSSNQVAGGDVNSGIMRDVEQGVLSSIAQPFGEANDPSKIAFIRLDVTKNAWVWSYFNDGTTTQSVDPKNGTPQYLFFYQGNLISVLIGNRDDSAFANWVRSNTTVDDTVLEPQENSDVTTEDAQPINDAPATDMQMPDQIENTDTTDTVVIENADQPLETNQMPVDEMPANPEEYQYQDQ
jgi:hypothetical protein